jgi:hypothetical protein
MDELEVQSSGCFNGLSQTVADAILQPPASSVQLIRTWLLELFVRGTISISAAQFKALECLPSSTDKRQLLLIRGRMDSKSYFRRQKTSFESFSSFEQSALVWGASCLPNDEFEVWTTAVKPKFNRPGGHLFLKWARDNRSKLISKLSASFDDHPE